MDAKLEALSLDKEQKRRYKTTPRQFQPGSTYNTGKHKTKIEGGS